MIDDEPEARVRLFLQEKIDSVEQLSILILLSEGKDRAWTVASLNDELRSAEASVANRLKILVERRVLAPETLKDPDFRYFPFDEGVRNSVLAAIALYRAKPYRVMEWIFSKPQDPIRSLADAFKIKKDRE